MPIDPAAPAYVAERVAELGLAEHFPGFTWTDADYGIDGGVREGNTFVVLVHIDLLADRPTEMHIGQSLVATGLRDVAHRVLTGGYDLDPYRWRPRTKDEVKRYADELRRRLRLDLEKTVERLRWLGASPGLESL